MRKLIVILLATAALVGAQFTWVEDHVPSPDGWSWSGD